jgi:thymidylate synthase ThyX
MTRFLSPEPGVVLSKAFTTPFQNAIATARTCYSGKGIVHDEQITEKHFPLARSVYQAGHHTVFTHAYFQFELSNVSRQFIWSFLHSHPFYNSEQVSQRYVEIKRGAFVVPPLEGEALEVYRSTLDAQIEAYFVLNERLYPLAEAAYFERFPARVKNRDRYIREIRKKCQEIARYVVPVSAMAYMYHTVSGITLMRYYRLCNQYDTPLEQRIVVEKMVQELIKVDPLYRVVLENEIPLEQTAEHEYFSSHVDYYERRAQRSFVEEFDRSLEGRISRLIDHKRNNEGVLAESVREVLGVTAASLSDEDAIRLALDPARNRIFGESLNLTTLSKISRAMFHPHYTFRKKLSHTADSQDQRHRLTPASRPVLMAHQTDEPDYVTPMLVASDDAVRTFYDGTMNRSWEGMNRLRRLGVPEEFVMYLLPNAVAVRFTESSDLLNLHHKMAMRLCYLAQEEIWRASVDEASQITDVNPKIGRYLLPPCGIRHLADLRPYCPEGDRFCGERVWTLSLGDYHRLI